MPENYVGISDGDGDKLLVTSTGTIGVTTTAGPSGSAVTIANSAGTAYSSTTKGTLNSLAVSNGFGAATATLSAVTANATGATVDAGSASSDWSAVAVAGGSPTAGILTLELSHDGTSWVSSTVTASVTAAGNYLLASTGRAARFARVSLSGLTGTINLTVTMMAAG